MQLGDPRRVVPQLGQDLASVLARTGGRAGHRRVAAAETWGDSRLGVRRARQVLVGRARLGVWVASRFVEIEDGGHAALDVLERRGPLVPRSSCEHGSERLSQARPPGSVLVTPGQPGIVEQPEHVERVAEEALLDRAEGHPPTVRTGVDVVVGAAGVEEVRASVRLPLPLGAQPVHQPHQGRGRLQHVRVDDLAATRGPGLEQGADDAEGQRRRTAAEVADEVERRDRALTGSTDAVQCTGHADVVDVVTRDVGQRSGLTPTGQAPVDQPRVDLEAAIGTEPSRSATPGR